MINLSKVPGIVTITNIGQEEHKIGVSLRNQSFIISAGESVKLKVFTTPELLGYLSQASETILIDYEEEDNWEVPDVYPVFDMRNAVNLIGLKGRCSVGIDHGPLYAATSTAPLGNLETIDSWNWSSASSDLAKNPQEMTLSGKYFKYELTFQTNNEGGTRGNLLEYLELNGERVDSPLYPRLYVEGNQLRENSGAEYSKTTVLSDGSIVTIEMIRAFNLDRQRVYKMSITNCRTDIVVTDGNTVFWYGEDLSSAGIMKSLVAKTAAARKEEKI